MQFLPGTLALNLLSNGDTLEVRVIEFLGDEHGYRVTDARETASDKQLVRRNRTWAAPASRLVVK